MHHYLVVANRTLGGPELLAAVRERMDRGPAAGEPDISTATARLEAELQQLRSIGANADGAVGHADPLRAIEAVVAERACDEIILSTLPPGLSRWLAMDLPRRLRRRTDVPLTVITTRDSAAERPPPGSR